MALAEGCDTDRLTELVQSKVQGAEAIRHHAKEMAFALPMDQVSQFPGNIVALQYITPAKTSTSLYEPLYLKIMLYNFVNFYNKLLTSFGKKTRLGQLSKLSCTFDLVVKSLSGLIVMGLVFFTDIVKIVN